MPGVARLGDTGSHGGAIVTGSPTGSCDGAPIARVGDTYACPIHGPNPIIEGSHHPYSLDGNPVSRLGDHTACGATITSASSDHTDE